MYSKTLSIGIVFFLLEATTSAAPLNPGPVETWFASSHLDTTCGGAAFQNFSGSSSSCNVIEDTHPPAEFIVQIKSILIGSNFGTYDFTFLPDSTCAVTGTADIIHEVSGGETSCVDVSGAGSFYVDNVSPPITTPPPALAVRAPESIWDATFFTGTGCNGTETKTFQGSSSVGCELVTDLLQPPGNNPRESNSILIHAEFATYDFSFFNNENCEIGPTFEGIYEVSSGQSQCVDYSDPVSFNVTEVTAGTKRALSQENKRSPIVPIAARIPGPESIWNLTTFGGQQCDGESIQNFRGSGSSSCEVISGNDGATPPGLPIFIETGSVLAQTLFGVYDFTFYPNQECEVGGTLEQIYQVDGERCISLGSLDPESFEVEFVEGELKRSNLLEARQGPIDLWGVSTFTTADCNGDAIENFGGTAATCDEITSTTPITSVLLNSDSGDYGFVFYPTSDCEATGINEEIYEVSTGESLCINLPTGLDPQSFQEVF